MTRRVNGVLIVDGALAVQGMAAFANILQSSGTFSYIPGSQGWQINYDGTAEFNNITLRGDLISSGSLISTAFGTQASDFLQTGTAVTWTTLAEVTLQVKAGKPVNLDGTLRWRIEGAGANTNEVRLLAVTGSIALVGYPDTQEGSTSTFTRAVFLFAHNPAASGAATYHLQCRKAATTDRDLLFRSGLIRATGLFN